MSLLTQKNGKQKLKIEETGETKLQYIKGAKDLDIFATIFCSYHLQK